MQSFSSQRRKSASNGVRWRKSAYYFIALLVLGLSGIILYNQFNQNGSSSQQVSTIRGTGNTDKAHNENFQPEGIISGGAMVNNQATNGVPISQSESIFVPYWASASFSQLQATSYDRFYYFGLALDSQGQILHDEGFTAQQTFLDATEGREVWLTIRMLDASANKEILKRPDSWNTIAQTITEEAAANNYKGVLLDLELGGLTLSVQPKAITQFTQNLKQSLQKADIKLGFAAYGDNQFRRRPYNLKELGETADTVVIMAYDFTKAFGEPGPNFPISGKEEFGYDFTTMIADFSRAIPAQKLEVAFGLYGYQWNVDNLNRPDATATAVSLSNIKANILATCQAPNCTSDRDIKSGENVISIKKAGDRKIVIWYEDETSRQAKQKIMQDAGILQTGYWVWGY